MKNIKNYEQFLNEKKKEKWIQGSEMKKGALKSMLGYKEEDTIPKGIIKKIVDGEVGSEVEANGEKHKITALMKKRANLAHTLEDIEK
jgi:hypothetical protein